MAGVGARVALVSWLALSVRADTETKPDKPYDVRLYGTVEQFEWKEYLDGQRLLEESGPIFGVGGDLALRLSGPLWVEGRCRLFMGDVDYDGGVTTADGETFPYQSTTEYAGMQMEADAAFRLPLSHCLQWLPYAGVGFRGWRRTLDTEFMDAYIGRYGYVENWLTLYGIVGCGLQVAVDKRSDGFARVEVRLPIDNSMTADLRNQDGPSDVRMDPGKRNSLSAEAGWRAMPLSVAFYVETLSFSESAPDGRYGIAFQPESEATILGLKLGVAF